MIKKTALAGLKIGRAGACPDFVPPFGPAVRLPPKAGCRRKTSGSKERTQSEGRLALKG